jgi:hypothetical protein
MFAAALLTVAALLPAAIAGPVNPAARSLSKRDLKAYAEEVTIHSSCNVTQSRQLQKALADTFEITAFAQKCKLVLLRPLRDSIMLISNLSILLQTSTKMDPPTRYTSCTSVLVTPSSPWVLTRI